MIPCKQNTKSTTKCKHIWKYFKKSVFYCKISEYWLHILENPGIPLFKLIRGYHFDVLLPLLLLSFFFYQVFILFS